MTFLNGALAFGAAASLIPLIIHILNRSRFKTVEWGAMHLLESVIKVNHKRFRLDQLILLLVRCAIPVLLALCLAKPVLTGSRLLEGDSPVSLVILLDTSYSMDAVDPSGTRFDSAVDAACAIIGAASRGSEVAVIQTGGRPTPLFDQPVFDPDAVIRKLKQSQAGYGASDMQASLDEAIATLSGMSHARRELIVISDFQPGDWDAIGSSAADSIRRQVDAMSIKPELTLLPIGQPVSGNVSVESLEFPRRALGVGQQLAVRANVRNHGTTPIDNVRVILRIDGVESSVSQIALTASGTTQTLFPCTFDKAGSHVIEAEVTVDDPLADDNRYAAAVTIWDSINVLLVDGDPSTQPLQSETDYLSIALTPFTFGRMRLADLVQTQTILAKDVNEELLKTARVVVLANVSKLEPAQLTALTAFVQDGGALLVCAGNKIDLDWYRENMFTSGTGLLPSIFGAPRGKIDETGKSAHIVAQHFEHPALEFFNEASNGDLSAAEIRQWHELTDIDPNAGSTVVVRLDNGDPLLVERRFGEGVVMQLATACDADWSDLPLRPFFVPLMQQLVTTMASGILPPRNITTGEPAVAVFANVPSPPDSGEKVAEGRMKGQDASLTLSVVTPDGSRRTVHTLPQGKTQVARFDGTQRPGVYAMSTGSAETLHFVAETSRDESDLSVLNEPGLVSLSQNMASTLIKSSAEYLAQDRLRRHGQEIWKYVLAALLAFMFLELVLQQRFARVRT
ncbi:MAG TPA: VWA domain-containing protein [Planctomycetaceae bacterium]|nr:VWA domain-containing protein [Planctomycetaceae bacterium]